MNDFYSHIELIISVSSLCSLSFGVCELLTIPTGFTRFLSVLGLFTASVRSILSPRSHPTDSKWCLLTQPSFQPCYHSLLLRAYSGGCLLRTSGITQPPNITPPSCSTRRRLTWSSTDMPGIMGTLTRCQDTPCQDYGSVSSAMVSLVVNE